MSVVETEHSFPARGVTLHGRSYESSEGVQPGVLFVSGAKPTPYSQSTDFNRFRQHLCREGLNSLIYDGAGFGENAPDTRGDSLNFRLEEAEAAFQTMLELNTDKSNIAVIATSMGAHVAARLLEKHPDIKALVFISGAIYGANAEDKLFGPDFSAAIRQPGSWQTSPALKILQTSNAQKLVVYPDREEVVPKEIQEGILKACGKKGELYSVKNTSHFFLSSRGGEDQIKGQQLADFFAAMTTFLKSELSISVE